MVSELVFFQLDDWRFAVSLSSVERIERIVSITTLPKAPDIVLGIINIHSGIVSAFNKIEKIKSVLDDPDVVDACVQLFREKEFRFE